MIFGLKQWIDNDFRAENLRKNWNLKICNWNSEGSWKFSLPFNNFEDKYFFIRALKESLRRNFPAEVIKAGVFCLRGLYFFRPFPVSLCSTCASKFFVLLGHGIEKKNYTAFGREIKHVLSWAFKIQELNSGIFHIFGPPGLHPTTTAWINSDGIR